MRQLIDKEKMVRTIRRLTHEIIEQNGDLSHIVLLGVKRKGIPLAAIIKENIKAFEQVDVECYDLDIGGYRDDKSVDNFDKLDINVTSRTVIIVDDVLYTGRTARAAMDAIVDLGRPDKIQLAVLVDRGHRELPIRADYIGKNLPTNSTENIDVVFGEHAGVYILNKEEK